MDVYDLLKGYDEEHNNPEYLSQYADWLISQQGYDTAVIREAQKEYENYVAEKKIQDAIDNTHNSTTLDENQIKDTFDTEAWDSAYSRFTDELQEYIDAGGEKIDDWATVIAEVMVDNEGYDPSLVLDVLEQALSDYYLEQNENAPSTSGKFWNSYRVLGGSPQEMYYGNGYNPTGEESTEAEVANGTRAGTEPIANTLEAILTWLRGPENNKPINVIVKPSSGWGEHNQQSRTMFGAVTGYNE